MEHRQEKEVADIKEAMDIVRASRNEMTMRMWETRKRVWNAENSARMAAREATLLKGELVVAMAADPTADYTVLLGFRVAEAQETSDMATLEVARSRIARDAKDAGFAQLRADIAATEAQLDAVVRADERLRQSVLRSRGRGGRFTFGGRSFGGREGHGAAIPSHRPRRTLMSMLTTLVVVDCVGIAVLVSVAAAAWLQPSQLFLPPQRLIMRPPIYLKGRVPMIRRIRVLTRSRCNCSGRREEQTEAV
jgi:hypothetical protein